jgi:RNA polymerase sigma factor (sigma-70 family)
MTADPLTRIVETLRTTLDADERSDAELLARVRADRDRAAVEAIVRRHGPKVLAACRKVLGPSGDVDDAFQATFLVLLRNPRAVRRKASLGAWLYGVAHRISLQARARQRKRLSASPTDAAPPGPDLPWREACAILHEELDRLPDATRLPLVLCYLDGLSRDEAAAQLGRSLNSVKKSLEKGREQLRKRLARRGVTLSAGLLAAVAEPVGAESMEFSPTVVEGVIRPSAAVSGMARTITDSGLRWRWAALSVLAPGIVVGIALGLQGSPKPQTPPKEVPPTPAAKKDAPPSAKSKTDRITFSGRVVDPGGKPVRGAKLFLWVSDTIFPEYRPSLDQRATTDAEGRFQFDEPLPVMPDLWASIRPQIVAVVDGFGLGIVPATLKGLTDVEVRLPADVPIRGRVLNLEGKPIAGARVRVVEVHGAENDDLSAWLKKMEANGWDDIRWVVASDLPRRLESRRGRLPGLREATTGADGRFSLSGVGGERVVRLALEGEGMTTVRLLVLTQEGKPGAFPPARKGFRGSQMQYYRQPFDYVAAPDQPFEGRVTDKETGEPIAGVRVMERWSETRTDRDGRYRLTGVSAGPTSILFEPGPELPYHVRSVLGGAKDSIQTARVDTALLRAPWVAGKVIDERTGDPVAGARVSYKPDRTNRRADDYFDRRRLVDVEVRTGPDGSFRLAGVPGRGWLFVFDVKPRLSAAERPVQGDTDVKEPPTEVQTSDQSGEGMSPRMYQALVALDVDPKVPKSYTVTVDSGINVPVALTDPAGKPVNGAIALGVSFPYYQWSKPLAEDKLEVPAYNPNRPRALFFYHPARDLGVLFQPKKGDAGPWAVTLQPTATVMGTLVLPNGDPYPNADLTLSFTYPGQRNPMWLPDHSADARFKTDAAGKFRFTKVIGDADYHFWYSVFQDSAKTTTTIPFKARPGETKDLGTIKTRAPRK